MGQKVHPIGFRIGVTKPWISRWYSEKNVAANVGADFKLRKFVKKKLYSSGVSKIEIERTASKLRVNVFSARPGIAIGKKGAGIEELRKELAKLLEKPLAEVFVNVTEVRKAEANAQLVAESIALQLERRVSYRRAMKRSIQQAMKFGVEGIKIKVGGRLNGAEIARNDKYSDGSIPLHTLRADIDFGFAEAMTAAGLIGVRVWIHKGEVDMRTRLGKTARMLTPNLGPSLI